MPTEVGISKHLDLLRKEHVRLQVKHAELQRAHDALLSANALTCSHSDRIRSAQNISTSNFVQGLLHIVTQLYDKDLYSDITIHVDGHQLRGHRIVIAARTDFWGDLSAVERLDLTAIPCNVAKVMMKWMYTNSLDEKIGDAILLPLLEASLKYHFEDLKSRCEEVLIARIDVENCARIYQFAELHSLDRIRDFCAEVVSDRWDEFTPEHFADMPAQLLYRLLKRKSGANLLGSLIRLQREDVLFLFLIENDARLKTILNEFDCDGNLPLDIAFALKQPKIAKCLVTHGADMNKLDERGNSLLWKAIGNGNAEVCDFLVENGANLNYVHEESGDTLLHVLAKSKTPQWVPEQMSHFDVNALDRDGRSPLIVAVEHENSAIIGLLMQQLPTLDVNRQDNASRSALQVALLERHSLEIAEKLIRTELDLLSVDQKTGQTLLHKATALSDHIAARFLAANGVSVDVPDAKGSTPLHHLLKSLPVFDETIVQHHPPIDASRLSILQILLQYGANPSSVDGTSGCTALHYAVSKPRAVLDALLPYCDTGGIGTPDREGRSPLWCALLASKFDIATLLIGAGADINEKSADGVPLLIKAIALKRDDISRFLLANKAIAAVTSPDGFTPLNLAVQNGLTSTVDQLCKLGANLNHPNPLNGLIPLWAALENDDFGTAEVLIAHGADTEGICQNDEQTLDETLLHRAIDKNNQKAAVFLIKSGCNVNALRTVRDVPSPSSRPHQQKASSSAPLAATPVAELYARSKQTPLHTAVQWGLTEVARALIANLNCRIDAQDTDGRTAAHIAVLEQDQHTLELLLSHPDPSPLSIRDRYGHTPLALAMRNKQNKMAEAICKRLPHAALQMNGSGENLLHCAVKASDLESVLFLLGIHIDVNIPTQDQERNTALHICSRTGDELILRNLILAGAQVDTTNANGLTALAISAMHGHVGICRALLENGTDANIANDDGNNALHAAVSRGAVKTVRLLLSESNVDVLAVNKRQQNILHLCAINIGQVSAEVFVEILKAHPNYPLETADMFGNTMFLLAFINGNSELCKLALKNGTCMGVMNNQGQTVFNFSTPTQQLLIGLLESLEREPKWAEGDACSECATKFTLTMRKHHCRHCGRLVCAKCSDQQIPILKYNLAKTVRVCQMCYGVLTLGTAPPSTQRK